MISDFGFRISDFGIRNPLAFLVVVLLGLLPAALGFDRFYLLTLTFGYLFVGLAISWFLLARAGQISLGHAAFFGLGAYASAVSVLRLDVSPWVGLVLGTVAAVLFAVVVGLVCFRFHGLYFALATFAAAEVAKSVVLNWDSLTYGAQGLVGIPGFPAFSLGMLHVDFETSRLPNYYVALIFLVATLLIIHWMIHGSLGLAFTAVRESEEAAGAIGINPMRIKVIALLVSAAVTGAGGAVYAHVLHYLEPNLVFSVSVSSLPLVMSLFGGLVSLAGPLIGGLLLYLVDALLFQRFFPAWHLVLYGATLIFVVLYMPRGLMGWILEYGTS
ncbi:MAG: branched-chain amino acid ABC transporter permease [Anaerolineae bacterium]